MRTLTKLTHSAQMIAILMWVFATLNMFTAGTSGDDMELGVLCLKIMLVCSTAGIVLHLAARSVNTAILIKGFDGKEYGMKTLWRTSNGYGGRHHPFAYLDSGQQWDEEALSKWLK